ncbi:MULTISPECIES: hypothetical protein [Streptomyces]|uniref:hypothetical protein n=1 Tax=Streptomyces TaxID=1883 RepID=UPI002FC86D20
MSSATASRTSTRSTSSTSGTFPPIALEGVEPPAAKPFEYDFKGVTIEDFTGIVLRVTADGTTIAASESTITV